MGWFIKWAASPEIMTSHAVEYAPELYDLARLDGEMIGSKKAVLTGYRPCASELLCRAHTAYYTGAYESTGAKNVRCEHEKCERRGMRWGSGC